MENSLYFYYYSLYFFLVLELRLLRLLRLSSITKYCFFQRNFSIFLLLKSKLVNNIDSNCILMYTVLSSNSICSTFYFYINSIARLSSWFFLQSFFFRNNAHREGIGKTNGAEGRPQRMVLCGVASQRVGIRIFALAPMIVYHMQI